MKKSNVICIILLCIGCAACHAPVTSTAYWKLQPEKIVNKNKTKVSEIIGNYSIIPLETTDSSFVGKITKIIRYKDRFYLSYNRTSLAVFDCTGKFIYKLEKVGRAPDEYIDLGDFDVSNDCIVVLDFMKVVFYDLDGNYLKSQKLDFVATNLKYVNDHRFLFHTSRQDHMIYLTDGNFKVLDKQIKRNRSTDCIILPTFIPFKDYIVYPCGYSTDCLAYEPGTDRFSKIILADHKTSFDNDMEENFIKEYGDNYSRDVTFSYTLNCRLTSVQGKCLLDYLYKDKEYWSVYDIKTGKSLDILYDNLIDDVMFTENDFLIYSTIHESDYKFLAPIWPARISEGIEEYLKANPEGKDDQNLIEMQDRLADLKDVDNANPFIIEFHFEE